MIVIDITDLETLHYGIVGFSVCRARFIGAPEDERYQMGATGPGAFETGPLRVIDDLRPRQAMSVSEYMLTFNYETPVDGNIGMLLPRTPLIDAEVMELIWPPDIERISSPTPTVVAGRLDRQSKYQPLMRLVENALELDVFDEPAFEAAYSFPGFRDFLRLYLVKCSEQLGCTCSTGQLLLFAFTKGEHLSLELLNNLSVEAIAAALSQTTGGQVISISICLDKVRGTPAQLIDTLPRANQLRAIYFLQSPTRISDELSVQIFEQLAVRPHMLSQAKVLLTGACSAALRKRLWFSKDGYDDATQLGLLKVFPVQQLLVRTQTQRSGPSRFYYEHIYLADGLLNPERLASGFLIYLLTLDPAMTSDA
jgi:hypothetical protein